MSTVVARPAKLVSALPGRRYDHVFFAAIIGMMLMTVIVGFGPTYYFRGVFVAPLPSPITHVHAALFSLWMLMLVAQTSLASVHRVDLHKRLGIAGFVVACLMVPAGAAVATQSLLGLPPVVGRDGQAFYIIPLSNVLIFAVLIAFAFRSRRDSATHKRLILIGTIALLNAAIVRFHIAGLYRRSDRAALLSYVFLLMIVSYDLWSLRKVHRSTVLAGAFLIVIQQLRVPIAQTAAWHAFAASVQAALR